MSSETHVRHPDDFYATPEWVTHAILPYLPNVAALDPCAGDGAIVQAVRNYGRVCSGIELSSERVAAAEARRSVHLLQGDGLACASECHALIIMNPPYKAAEQWVRAMFEPGRTVAALLRLGFLASSGRANLFAAVGIPDVYVLSRRPSFTGNGKSDGTDYAWMVWGPGRGGRIVRLEVPL